MDNLLKTNKERLLNIAYLLIALAVFSYILIRALKLSVNYDEAYTLRHFVPSSIMEIISYELPIANNHLLNTLLIKLFYSAGPKTLFVARLPNVLACIMYLYFAFRICKTYLGNYIGLFCFSLLVLNPFLLDFFSMARGYGLMLAFYIGSLFYLIRFIQDKHQRSGTISLIFGAFAILSCLCMINFWLISLGVFVLLAFMYKQYYPSRRPFIYYFITLFALVAILWEPIRKMTAINQMYYGGKSNIYTDTLLSVARYTVYQNDVIPSAAIKAGLNVFLILFVLVAAISLYYQRTFFSVRNGLLGVLLLCLTAIILQHLILGSPYIIDRTALYLFPLFILVFSFSAKEIPSKTVAFSSMLVLLAFFGVNFLRHANFYKSALWYYDAHTPKILLELNEIGKKEGRTILVGYSHVYSSSFEYYDGLFNYSNLHIATLAENDDITIHDYHVHLSEPLDVVYSNEGDPVFRYPFKTVIKTYPEESIVIYRMNRSSQQ